MREMKDSGLEWIEHIPHNWTTDRIKYLFESGKGLSITKENLIDEGLPVISYGQIHAKTNNGVSLKPELIRFVDWGYKDKFPQCSVGQYDFVFADTSEDYDGCGNCIYKRDDTTLFGGYHTIILRSKEKRDNRYLAYLFQTDEWRKQVRSAVSGVKVFSVTQKSIMNTSVVLPNYEEQQKIADYLDYQTGEVDSLSADIQLEIEILEAYKRSTVFDVVEHGVGNTEFKETDSDVWTTIPMDWELVDIKYIFEIVKRIAGKEGYDVISITQQGLKYKDITSNEGQLAADYSGYQFVYPGDYAMNHMDLLTGWVDLSDKFGVTSPDYRVFRLRYPERFDRKYYKYVMQCCYMNRIFYSMGQGVSNLGRWRLQASAFNNFKVPVPSYSEQIKIGDWLEEKIQEINDVIENKKEQLNTLSEYKKAIIYEYITGKKEVPNERHSF